MQRACREHAGINAPARLVQLYSSLRSDLGNMQGAAVCFRVHAWWSC
jgi:hypothetical protein